MPWAPFRRSRHPVPPRGAADRSVSARTTLIPVHPPATEESPPVSASRPAAVMVLAAGEGTRMKSRRPKVLHEICGRSLLGHVLAAVAELEPQRTVVVVGHAREQVTEHLKSIAPHAITAARRAERHRPRRAHGDWRCAHRTEPTGTVVRPRRHPVARCDAVRPGCRTKQRGTLSRSCRLGPRPPAAGGSCDAAGAVTASSSTRIPKSSARSTRSPDVRSTGPAVPGGPPVSGQRQTGAHHRCGGALRRRPPGRRHIAPDRTEVEGSTTGSSYRRGALLLNARLLSSSCDGVTVVDPAPRGWTSTSAWGGRRAVRRPSCRGAR